jgi:spore coat protein CotF
MGLKGRVNKLTRQAEEGAVLIRLRDGTTKAFDAMTCFEEMFLAQMDLFMGEALSSGVLAAVRNATPQSRAAFEEQFGEITMEAQVVAGAYEGAWVEVYKLLEDGAVTKVRHEGGSPEAQRIREEARQQPPAF